VILLANADAATTTCSTRVNLMRDLREMSVMDFCARLKGGGGNTSFTQLSQQSFCELGMKGCKRIQKNCATGLCTLLRSLVFYPWPQVLDGPSANLEVPFASHCDTRTIRVLGELAITLPVKDRTICRRAL